MYAKQTDGKTSGIPGGVPQQSRRSSTCSTSNPMNQDPRDTSSLAYLCRTCLKCHHPIIMGQCLSSLIFVQENQGNTRVQLLTGWVLCRTPDLWRWRTADRSRVGSIYFPIRRISSIQARGTSHPWQQEHRTWTFMLLLQQQAELMAWQHWDRRGLLLS